MGCEKRIVLVCEDTAHRDFIFACLRKLGVKNLRHIVDDWVASERFQGGNVQTVINHFNQTEYKAWQRRVSYKKVLLIVVADADDQTVEKRRQAFRTEGVAALCVVMIPKRNIQTWVHLGLNASTKLTNEEEDYKKCSTTRAPQRIKKSVNSLFSWFQSSDAGLAHASPAWQTFAQAFQALTDGYQELGS